MSAKRFAFMRGRSIECASALGSRSSFALAFSVPLSAEELRQELETNFKGLDTDTLQGLAAGAVRSLANQAKATLYDRIREEWDDER